MYSNNEPNLQNLIKKSKEIISIRKQIVQKWDAFERHSPKGFVAPYLLYSVYLEQVNNLPSTSYEFASRQLINAIRGQDLTKSKVLNNDNIFSNQIVQIQISVSEDSMGQILECSPGVEIALGYNR
mmetsp:Transcript_22360/g.19269  ORF Transcript_22360/g.19269 Transcript_22360/m.19269 type:complete len:126 (-) Transcript_22360:645-1022(-)